MPSASESFTPCALVGRTEMRMGESADGADAEAGVAAGACCSRAGASRVGSFIGVAASVGFRPLSPLSSAETALSLVEGVRERGAINEATDDQ